MSVAAALAVGVAIILFLVRSRANYLRLPELSSGSATYSITVVIPARNEEHNIERAVRSFRDDVIVVDDGSTDATSERALAAGATVIQPPPLEPGMLGKPNACLAGANALRIRLALFVDADTWYEPAFVPALVSYAQRNSLDMASVFLRQECLSVIEKILLPYAFALYFCGVHAESVNNAKSAEALANGQCMLFRRSAYRAIGGHAAVASSVIEDVSAGPDRQKAGTENPRPALQKSWAMFACMTASGGIWRGFQKNSFRFLLVNPISGLQVIAASILLTSYLPVLAWLLVDKRWVAAGMFAVLPPIGLAPWYGKWSHAVLAPRRNLLISIDCPKRHAHHAATPKNGLERPACLTGRCATRFRGT